MNGRKALYLLPILVFFVAMSINGCATGDPSGGGSSGGAGCGQPSQGSGGSNK